MSVKIASVEPGSPAEKQGITPGETLISINKNEIRDILDYRFFEAEREVLLELGTREFAIQKGEYEALGLGFDTYLMDKKRSCKNKCVFCFIDQMPKGLRESLYFKDDDERLSFLFGNYVTLTNLTEREIDRIIQMKISPVNISVHTTNPELRVKMMANKSAGEVLKFLPKLAEAGIKLNCQLVLCPGINDGGELERSLHDLVALSVKHDSAVQSIAVVPVGLTAHRDGLCNLRGFTGEEAGQVVGAVEMWQKAAYSHCGSRLVWAADEFYLACGRELPGEDFYEGYPQLENGVGLIASLREEFLRALDNVDGGGKIRRASIATGASAGNFIESLLDGARKKWHNNKWADRGWIVYPIRNDFFGPEVTVAGLVTGRDLVSQLKGRDLRGRLLIPSVMLRREGDLFLDGMSAGEVSEALGVPVEVVPVDGESLLKALSV
ncbi:MAG: DUF512 domain-containing protein [Oscillospiraceae bacterium]|nr:DUF512 domain-containing protein [Oscillospiraceae bacterium]